MKKQLYSLILFIFSCNIVLAQNIYADITADSAYSLVQANINNPNFIILDVRTPNEYFPEHLKNAVNLNYYNSDFAETLDTLIKTKKYLIHCHAGSRSVRAFKKMKELKFKEVYNLKGGIRAWKSASYPVTDTLAPVLMKVSKDSLIDFGNIHIGYSDTIDITVTNYGNDTLKFSNLTDLSATEFGTNFDINHTLTGFDDYTFQVYYIPTNYASATTGFSIESNGGSLDFILYGYAQEATTKDISNSNIFVYPNPTNSTITISNTENINIDKAELYDLYGKKIMNMKISIDKTINLNYLQKGIYLLKLKTSKSDRSIKIIKR